MQRVEVTMSKKFIDRITLLSVLSGFLLAVSVLLPLHDGHTSANPVTAHHQFGSGSRG